jgi:3-phosphoshikimate 1-carboxyvinyltransferase
MVREMIQRFERIKKLKGELKLCGDKSISHRAVMFASMAKGISLIKNCSGSEDVNSTMKCFEKLGCKFDINQSEIKVTGSGFKGFTKPGSELYAGNSGTTARLMSGILAAQNFDSVITGDESLSSRPMRRIVEPLLEMGANITVKENGTMPIIILPSNLNSVNYRLKIASAQVKSAMLLCGLHLEEESTIIETSVTRNHTEKMLGLKSIYENGESKIFVSKKNYPQPFEIIVPSDISSAAFFIVAALILKNSYLRIKNVSLNETRTGIVSVLQKMGGKIQIENVSENNGEKSGDLLVQTSDLENKEIEQSIIPNIIDEIPILSVAGIFAHGNFKINGAKELRVKESDRIKSLCHNFKKAGIIVNEFDDGFELSGSLSNKEIVFESFGDHRIAMAFGVLSLLMEEGGSVKYFECAGVSNPDFVNQLLDLSNR